MPEWMTPLLWPVWCAANPFSFSTTPTVSLGKRWVSSIAVAMPNIPPPTTAMSYVWSAIKSPNLPLTFQQAL